ncbi:MAG: PucR family transcriptional regulator [Solirubrobacteraceae bacterium]
MTGELGLSAPADGADTGGAAAADAIKRRLDDAVGTARERMLVQEPVYRRMSQEELADVTALLYRNYGVLLAAMAGARVDHQKLDFVGEHVRARVRSGIPLEAVLEAYRIGLNVFWEECTAEVAAGGMSRDAAVNLARKMSEAMDTLTTHAAAAYVREESYLKAAREKAARDLLEALLRGDADPSRFELHNIAPGLDPQADLVVIVGRVSTEESRLASGLDTAAAVLGDLLATRRVSPLLVVREQAVVAVVLAEATDLLTERLMSVRSALAQEQGIDLYCGVSSPCGGFGGVAAAHEQASLAVSRASVERPVISLAVLPAIQHLLTGATLTTRLHLLEKARMIRSLQNAERQTMRATLHGFATANMNVTRGAAALHIHENTLRYRLRRLRQRTGHDPQTFAGLLELLCLMEIVDTDDLPEEQPPGEVRVPRSDLFG